MFTVWPGCTPEQLWSAAVDPSGQRGDTDTQYLLTALSSTETATATSDNNLWVEQEWKEMKKHLQIYYLISRNPLKPPYCAGCKVKREWEEQWHLNFNDHLQEWKVMKQEGETERERENCD